MNKVFLMTFLVLSLMGCGTLSTNASGENQPKNKDGTQISIFNMSGVEKRADAAAADYFGNGNIVSAKALGFSSARSLGYKTKKGKIFSFANSTASDKDYAIANGPDGKIAAENISINGLGTQSLLGNW